VFSINRDSQGVVHLVGRLDASQVSSASEVFDQIEESCTVDFSEFEYISSVGIGVLLVVQQRLGKKGESLTLINMTPHIRNVFKFAGLDRVFQIIDA
jgi:anti-anti-sigma factor